MKQIFVGALVAALLSGGVFLCTGCEREGPAERAGKEIDRAVKDAQDALDPAGPMEKAGKKIDRAVEDVTK